MSQSGHLISVRKCSYVSLRLVVLNRYLARMSWRLLCSDYIGIYLWRICETFRQFVSIKSRSHREIFVYLN